MKDNICLAFCGVCRAKSSSALSLKTVRRTVFLTLAFESRPTREKYVFYMAARTYVALFADTCPACCGVYRATGSSALSLKMSHCDVFTRLWRARSPSSPVRAKLFGCIDGGSDGTRTRNLLIDSQVLLSVELPSRIW